MTSNPFAIIDQRLGNIETLLLDIRNNPKPPELPDRMNLDELCKEFGFSKAFVYKETSSGVKGMPCERFGSRLVFSRREIKKWMTATTVRKQSPEKIAAKKLQKSAK
jgi:predicted DNA-binding transcriptional regulator AlpA